jgi:uncharacterized protein (TIGR02996 family)
VPDEQGFIAAIAESPDDDALRLIFADWLEENGDPVRAQFIRVQCELARLNPADARYPELHVRQLEMLAERERDWLGEWSERLVRWEFRRGLLHGVTITPEPFVAHGSDLVSRHPVERFAFVNEEGESLPAEDVRRVVDAPAMAAVRAIEAAGCRADEPHWDMYGGWILTNDWLQNLASARHVARLEELNLTGGNRLGRDRIDPHVWEVFCRAPHLRTLRHLDLTDWTGREDDATLERVRACLVASPFADRLRVLFGHPTREWATTSEARLAVESGSLSQLVSLCVFPPSSLRLTATQGTTHILDQCRQILARWPGLSGITELAFTNHHDLGDHGCEHLLRSPFVTCGLERLDLSGACRTIEGTQALAECPAMRGLRWLGYGYNDLTLEAMTLLLRSPYLRHLEALHLGSERDRWTGEGEASEAALILLAESEGFPRLRDVVVGSGTSEKAITTLRKRFGPRLRVWCDV